MRTAPLSSTSRLTHGSYNRDVRRQVQVLKASRRDAVPDSSLDEASVALQASVSRLIHLPRYIFDGIDVVTALSASAKLRRPLLKVSVKLVGVVERGHYNVPAFSPIRVIAVVPNDPARDAVILGICPCHGGSIRVCQNAANNSNNRVKAASKVVP
jgi:hypothetical protein